MYTIMDARNHRAKDIDGKIQQAVEASPERKTWMPVYADGSSPYTAQELMDALKERGFENVELRDPHSLRFAEVHFSW